jgi:hypothetical protein
MPTTPIAGGSDADPTVAGCKTPSVNSLTPGLLHPFAVSFAGAVLAGQQSQSARK